MNPTLDCTSDRDPLSYRAGEPMVFSFRASNAPAGARIRWRRTGDDGRAESGVMAFYNALACPKEITFVQGATHFSFPAEPAQTAFRATDVRRSERPE